MIGHISAGLVQYTVILEVKQNVSVTVTVTVTVTDKVLILSIYSLS